MGRVSRLIDTVRHWWTLAERMERTTEQLREAVDAVQEQSQRVRGER